MASIDKSKRKIDHWASGYGVVFYDGEPEEREELLREYLSEPFAVIDCREVSEMAEIYETVILQTDYGDEGFLDTHSIGPIDMNRALRQSSHSLLILEFEELNDDAQKSLAQYCKGLGEDMNFDKQIGYACAESDSVVQAEWDLTGRILSVPVEE